MRKNYLFFATAAMIMASCVDDDFKGNDASSPTGTGAIAFNMNTPAMSRGTRTGGTEEGSTTGTTTSNSTDAGKLGKMFIVWGEKNENQANGGAAGDGNIVFQNYVVKYTENTANTTTSNTNNWEYVGITPYSSTQVSPSILTEQSSDTKQTIKYWDDQASGYTFTAVSALDSDINPTESNASATVIIQKITGATSTTDQNESNVSVYNKGYTIQVKSGANTDKIFYSDRKYIAKSSTEGSPYDHNAVQLTFRNFKSKIRFGIYETVPGYKVVITGIKYNSSTGSTAVTHPTTSENPNKSFGIDGKFIVPGDNTKYTVTYVSSEGDDQNKAQVAVDSGSSTADTLRTNGTSWLDATSGIGTTANAPTYDYVTTEGQTSTVHWTTILPNPSNSTNLKLQIAYKLISDDTGEVIEFKNGESEIFRTVEVPAAYCQWKSNYAYTYLFKITDKSADLYPITFDACVVESETGNQETITTVTEPSITTYVKGKQVSNEYEYAAGDEIYAYAQDGTSTANMTSSNMKLYKVTLATGVTGVEITEAAVKHALEQTNVTNKKLTVTEIKSEDSNNESSTPSDKPSYETIPSEDGGNRTITGMKWTASASTTYAVEYIKTTGSGNESTTTKYYKIVKVAAAQQQQNQEGD